MCLKRMRILVVSQYYYPEPFRLNEVCEELVSRGYEVTVLTSNPNYPDGELYEGYFNKENKEEIKGVNIIRCKCRPRHKGTVNLALNYIDFVIKACMFLNRFNEKFDCIYMYQLSPITSCIPAIKFKRKHKIPLYLYCLDVWPESLKGSALGNPVGMKLLGVLSKYIYNSADRIAVTSPAFIKYIEKICDYKNSQIDYIPQHANRILNKVSEVKNNKNSGITNFLFVGNIGEAQNVECIIRAVSLVQNKSQIRIHIVGTGSRLEKCKKLVKELKLEDTIIFHGRYPKDKLDRFYSIADVCLVSLRDSGIVGKTIPGKIQEYMSMKKPILACMNGDVNALIKSADCGICVPANNEIELAKAMTKMSYMNDELLVMGEKAYDYYCAEFTLKIHVDRLEDLLLEGKNVNKPR